VQSPKKRPDAPRIHVALIRGINVGPNKRVRMEDLRAMVEGAGFTNARTLLNSGNVVFDSQGTPTEESAQRIESAMEKALGWSARVITMSAEELASVVDANPLAKVADNSSRLLLGIMADPADRVKLADIAKQRWGTERISLPPAPSRAVYLWMPAGVIASKLNAAVAKALGDGITARNWATMLKLKEMAEQM